MLKSLSMFENALIFVAFLIFCVLVGCIHVLRQKTAYRKGQLSNHKLTKEIQGVWKGLILVVLLGLLAVSILVTMAQVAA